MNAALNMNDTSSGDVLVVPACGPILLTLSQVI